MKKIMAILISFSIIFGIFLFFIDFMALDRSYYNNFHEEYKISEESGLEDKWIKDASDGIIRFLKNGKTSELSSYFNDKEIKHMEDVYKLFKIDRFVYKSLLIFSFLSLVYLYLNGKMEILAYIKRYFLRVYFGIVILFGALSGFFSISFEYFHKIFFTNDLWILDYETDLMIRILPEEFFLNMFLNVLVLFSVTILLAYFILKSLKLSVREDF